MDRAILDAAIAIVTETGIEDLTIDGVARRAGVGRPTVYRRYKGKLELLLAAVSHIARQPESYPDTGSTEGDLRVIATTFASGLSDTAAGQLMPWMIAEGNRDPERAREYHAYVTDRRGEVVNALRRGIERGDLRPDVDLEVVADFLAAPIFFRLLFTGAPADEAFIDTVVEVTLRGFGPTPR